MHLTNMHKAVSLLKDMFLKSAGKTWL